MDFLDDITTALGGKGRPTSGARTVKEQEALFRRGATRARGANAPHVRTVDGHPGAVDIAGYTGAPEQLAETLTRAGYPVKRVIRESGKGKNQGTGAHDHVEFEGKTAPGSGGVPATQTRTPQSGVDMSGPSAPVAPMNPSVDPFKMEPVVGALAQNANEQAAAHQDVLGQVTQSLQNTQREREIRAGFLTLQKEAVLKDQEAAARELHEVQAPILAARTEVADRIVKVQKMPWLKREILSMFNPNFDPNHLKEVQDGLTNQINTLGAEYEANAKFHETLINVAAGRFEARDESLRLKAADDLQDLSLSQSGYQLAEARLSTAMQGLSAGSATVQAQAVAKARVLDDLLPQDITTALAQARKGDGVATIGGVPLTIAELTDRSVALENRDINIKQSKMALQAQEMQLVDYNNRKIIDSMSESEINKVIANGGEYNGVQLSQSALTSALADRAQRGSLQAQLATGTMSQATWTQTIDTFNEGTKQFYGRVRGIFGANMPAPLVDHNNRLVAMSRQFEAKLHQAPEAARAQMRVQFMSQIQAEIASRDALVDTMVKSMSTNPKVQNVLGAFARGIQPTGEAAVDGLIALVESGNLPKGMSLSGPAAAAVVATRATVAKVRQKYMAESPENQARLRKGDKALDTKGYAAEVRQAVTQAVTEAYGNKQFTKVVEGLPELAKQSNHPAGKIRPEDWAVSVVQGDAIGLQNAAVTLGIKPELASAIFGPNGSGRDGWAAAQSKNESLKAVSYEKAVGMVGAKQSVATLQELDKTPSATAGFKPSAALTSYVRSPEFHQTIQNYSRNLGRSSLGDMFGDSISQGSLVTTVEKFASGLLRAQGEVEVGYQADNRRKAALYRGDPVRRATVILGGIDGLNEDEEQALLGAVVQQADARPGVSGMDVIANNTQPSRITAEKIDSFILNGKFDDPQLEKFRRIAAKGWAATSRSIDTAMDRYQKQ